MSGNTGDDGTYTATQYISLDSKETNTIYSNSLNQIHVQVKFTIGVEDGSAVDPDPTQNKAVVTLVEYTTGAPIRCSDDGAPTVENPVPGWSYSTIKGDYCNPFVQGAGPGHDTTNPSDQPSTETLDSTPEFEYRHFYLSDNSGTNDGLQVASCIAWKDPKTGKPLAWDTTATGTAPASVQLNAITPKTYSSLNTNGAKLDYQDYGYARIPAGSTCYLGNFFFKITDPGFKIKSSYITGNTVDSPFAVTVSNGVHVYFYAWPTGDYGTDVVKFLDINVSYNQRANQLCIARGMISNYNADGDGWNNPLYATIYDDYGNIGKFKITIGNDRVRPQLLDNN
ncbi:hypothetical protein AB1286_03650 [Trinickia sp. NRRL B-1857]|uniref:hypothetical protein n=1 Tax=Trinickia sp. NRRL B-1857 TaxID=3162879 RepID=UPI003D2E45C3